jgi:hypothetical protein
MNARAPLADQRTEMAFAAGASPTTSAPTAINDSSERRTGPSSRRLSAAYAHGETARHQEMG